ncbi:hypothetical protein DAI22_03g027401 [Oryza sativa Japonica Group]|nr:hypothetical protein DAI22_03g027401 [Oryza sativa Japonica Group]
MAACSVAMRGYRNGARGAVASSAAVSAAFHPVRAAHLAGGFASDSGRQAAGARSRGASGEANEETAGFVRDFSVESAWLRCTGGRACARLGDVVVRLVAQVSRTRTTWRPPTSAESPRPQFLQPSSPVSRPEAS